MKEYLVELKGVYYIPEELKDIVSGLDLAVLNYGINNDNNIRIKYLSFLIECVDEKSLIPSEEFIRKIKKGLRSEGKEFVYTPDNEYKYMIYKDEVLKYLKRENLHYEIISIRASGRIKVKDGFEYNGRIVSYKDFTSIQKAFLTKFLARMLTSKSLEELDNYYTWAKDRVEIIGNDNLDFIEKAEDYINHYYLEQKKSFNKDIKKINI